MSRERLLLLLLVVVGAVHLPAWFGGFVYDDRLVIEQNAALQSGDLGALLTQPYFAAGQGYWRPLTSLALWLGNSLGGAFGIHVLAWCAHLGATFFAWRIASVLLEDPRRAFFAALLFGLHPVQVEGVAWCSAINDPLFWCFGLAGVDAALRSRDDRMIAWLLLALFAKENALALVPVAALARWRSSAARARALGLLAAVLVAWWIIRMAALHDVRGRTHDADIDAVVAANWLAGAVELFGRELELLVWPWPQSLFRALTLDGGTTARAAAWAVAWLVGLVLAWRRAHRTATFGLVLVAAQPLLCAVSCDRIGAHPVADRYLGPSVLGASLLLAIALRGRALLACTVILGTIAGVGTALHTATYRDQQRFVEHALATAPFDPKPLCMAGNLALERGDAATAGSLYANAIERAGTAPRGAVRAAAADSHVGLGWCALASSPPAVKSALRRFGDALRIDSDSVTAWIGFGVAHGMNGDPGLAQSALEHATAIAPRNSQAHYNLAFLFERTGRTAEAREHAAAALRNDPNHAQARALLDRLR